MPRCTALLVFIVVLFCTAQRASTQVPAVEAKGLLVYKDRQTDTVEAFEFTNAEEINAYTTRYSLASGVTRSASNAGVLLSIRYSARGVPMRQASEIQSDLKTLDSLAVQYPRYSSVLAAASSRLRADLQTTNANKSASGPANAQASGANGPSLTLMLKDGTRLQNAHITHVGSNSVTVIHERGVAEVDFDQFTEDLAGLPTAVRAAVVQARLARASATPARNNGQTPPVTVPLSAPISSTFVDSATRARTAGQTPAATVPSIPNSSTLAGIQAQRDKAIAASRERLAHETEAAQKELERLTQEAGTEKPKESEDEQKNVRMLTFEVQRKLDPNEFGGNWPPGADLYQIRLSAMEGGGLAILRTDETRFSSEGKASMIVDREQTVSVKLKNGFERDVPVYVELPPDEAAAWKAKRSEERKGKSKLAVAKKSVEEAAARQQLFDYATTKFGTLPFAPVCHLSSRLQALGFRAEVASAQWNKILGLIAQADWPGLVREELGMQAKMSTPAEVDAAYERLAKTPVTVAIKSDQCHLVMSPGGHTAYLEKPGQHRRVSVAALCLPATPSELCAQLAGMKVDLGNLPRLNDLEDSVLPDTNGYVAKWEPANSEMFFCINVSFANQGERTASADVDALCRAIVTETGQIKHRKELGELAESDVAAASLRNIGRLFDYARGPLLSSY